MIVKKSILKDIKFRLKAIKIKREKEMPWLRKDALFNELLKIAEYFDRNPYDELFKTYHSAIYKFLDKSESDKESAKKIWKKAELEKHKMDKKIKKDLIDFKQKIDTSIIKNSEKFLIKNYLLKNIDRLLNDYYHIDEDLTMLELYLDQMSEQFDRDVQREIDMRRGK